MEEIDTVGDGLVVVRVVHRLQVRAAARRPLRRNRVLASAPSVGREGHLGRPRREGEQAHHHLPEPVHDPGRPPRRQPPAMAVVRLAAVVVVVRRRPRRRFLPVARAPLLRPRHYSFLMLASTTC